MNPSLVQVLLVGLGGFFGSGLRFLVGNWAQRAAPISSFPYGILAVNVLGCLAIGFLGGLSETRQFFGTSQRLFLFTGVLGGFTTFSTFAYDTLHLTLGSEPLKAILNVSVSVALGLGAAWLGFALAKHV